MSDGFLFRMWDHGQQHLAAGRYVAARSELETAEAIAWRDRDAQSLARLYLPLLEARRQIRYHAVEGNIFICPPGTSSSRENQLLSRFLTQGDGTILLACSAQGAVERATCRLAGSVQYASRRTGRWLEALLLITQGNQTRITSQADPTFAAGLPVSWTSDPSAAVGSSTDPHLSIPLPAPGSYPGNSTGLPAVARESLLIAWEALALRWQSRHPPPHSLQQAHAKDKFAPDLAWTEMAWLRLALRIDPACEPITMRLIALAEAIQRES
jgi:hypothetical protein